jgi:hypothetical protein
MAWFHNLNSDTKNAIKWIAAEYKYLKELRDDLERIKNDNSVSEQEKDYKNVRRAWYYIRRCERRTERNIERIIEDLKREIIKNPSLVPKDPDLINLKLQIEISSEKLLKAFSATK